MIEQQATLKDAKWILDRSKPPMPGPLAAVSFPKYKVETLSNGVKVYIVENHLQPIASVVLYVPAGSRYDPRSREGLAAMTADMLLKGTKSRTAPQIAEEIDFVGGSLSATASWDAATLGVGVLTKFLGLGLELLADITLNPAFEQEELDRVKLQRTAALQQAKADASYLADMLFGKLVFPNHPYGQAASGTERSVEVITADDLRAFYRSHFIPSGAFFVAAGDLEPVQFVADLERLFGGWTSASAPMNGSSDGSVNHKQELQAGVSVGLVEKQGAVQSAIRLGHLGIARNDPDYIRLFVLNMLLGGYFNSRINLNLREKHGFTYGARSYFDARMEAGPFVVSTEVSSGVTVRAIEEMFVELHRIIAEEITDEELTMVKNYVIGSFPLQIETPQQVASRLATIVLYNLDENYYDSYRQKVAALTKRELLDAARTYLHPDRATIVVSGDVPVMIGEMGKFGKVAVYGSEGERLGPI